MSDAAAPSGPPAPSERTSGVAPGRAVGSGAISGPFRGATPDDALAAAFAQLDAGRSVALATVIETWGSSPRPAGSTMCIPEAGAVVGSVSGGCVENAVVEEARAVLDGGPARALEFGVADETAWEVGLACGGRIRVWLERLGPEDLDRLPRAVGRGAAVVRVLDLATGASRVVGADPAAEVDADGGGAPETHGPVGGRSPALQAAVDAVVAEDRSAVAEIEGVPTFLHLVAPPVRVLIVGAVHLAQHLAPMVRAAGWDGVVIDPRTRWASAERFPGVERVCAQPAEALERLGLDARTAVVAISHDPKFDDPALAAALAGGAFYVGALGSRKTHAARCERLVAAGVSDEAIARIRAPIGLDIGSRTPGEIAASIVGEIVAVLRGRGA